MHPLLNVIIMGLGATLIFDLWALFLKYAFKTAPSNFCLVGRWIRYVPEGIVRYSNIAFAPQKGRECLLGWVAHYLTGMIFAIVFVAFMGTGWLEHPKLFPAVLFGIVSVLMPFLIMQPAFGLGLAASKTSNPMESRLRSLMNHTVFGIGLHIFGLLGNWLL
jgi:hypothetical protein